MAGRVFLVDDERPVLDGISAAIKKRLPDVEIVGTASSGRDAVEGVARLRPDVVLMDVRMPGMSGLEALRELKSTAPDTVPVLLTAYERFDVAKEAFGLGVYDYLVKPVDQDLLVAAIRGALDAAAARKAEAARARDAIDALERQKPLLEEGLVLAAVSGGQVGGRLVRYAEALGMAPGRCCMAAFGRPDDPSSGGLSAADADALRAALGYRAACAVGAPMAGIAPVFFPCEQGPAAQAIDDALREGRFDGLRAGLGIAASFETAASSWLSALAALVRPVPGLRVSVASAPRTARQSSAPPQDGSVTDDDEYLDRTLRAAADGDGPAALEAWSGLSAGGRMAGALRAVAAGAAVWSLRRSPEALAELALSLADGGEPSGAFLGSQGAPVRGAPAKAAEALRYIGERYAEQLSLELVAEQVGLSPAHLSRVLSAETGRSFMEHLSDVRMSRAKTELASGRLSVKMVGAAVGYVDPNYFSRVFKRETGMTPLEYAEASRRRGNES